MKKFKKLLLGVGVLGAMSLGYIALTTNTSTYATQPGSPQDPLVSRSYLEQRLASLTLTNSGGSGDGNNPVTGQELMFNPVHATVGQVVFGAEGTEIILRSGEAIVFSEAMHGLVNVTTGQEIFHGDPALTNNVLIVP